MLSTLAEVYVDGEFHMHAQITGNTEDAIKIDQYWFHIMDIGMDIKEEKRVLIPQIFLTQNHLEGMQELAIHNLLKYCKFEASWN